MLRRLRVARALFAAELAHRADADTLDPEQARIVAALTAKVQAAFQSIMPPPDAAVTLTAQGVQAWAEAGATREVERLLQISAGTADLARTASERQLLKLEWVRANTASIRALEEKLWRSIVAQAIEDGLAAALRDRFRVAENEARLLARDQIGTLQGKMQASSQQALGAMKYEWSSMEDTHVRPAHRQLDGTVREWDDPVPQEGHPGEAFGCRCVAQPRADKPPKLDLRKLSELNLFPGVPNWKSELRRIFGRPVTAAEILGWAGFRPEDLAGARVTLNLRGDRVVLEADARKFGLSRLYRPGAAFHDSLGVKETGQGFGSALFGRQAEALRAAGFTEIHLNAGGYPGGSSNGFYTWPRLGFDGALKPSTLAILPPELAGATRVSDLMLTEAGRDWWKAHGVAMDLSFDLSPGSLSSRILADYLAERAGRADGLEVRRDASEEITLSAAEEEALDRVWAREARRRGIIPPPS